MSNFWLHTPKPLIGLSPMDGITDFPMREIQAEIAKPDVIYTEFVSIEGFLRKPEKFLPTLKFSEKQRPVVAQLFGSDPRSFAEVLTQVVKLGFDGIDINMGCPSKNVLEQGGGGALIGHHPQVEKIITSSLGVLKNIIPLSIKTRIMETEKNTLNWVKFLSSFPVSTVCIHGRPLKQLHSGPVGWDQLEKCAQFLKNSKIVFLGNGGIKNRNEGIETSRKYHLDGVLIGKAAIGNPWVFQKNTPPVIASPTEGGTKQSPQLSYHPEHIRFTQYKLHEGSFEKKNIFSTLLHHSQLVYDFYGEKNFNIIRKYLSAYCKNFPGSKTLRLKLLLSKNPQEIDNILKSFK